MKRFKIILFLCICSGYCWGQKQIRYCQIGLSPYGSSCYILKRLKTHADKGTFEINEGFDDGQKWNGKGTYTMHNKKVLFSQYKFIRRLNNVKDSTVIVPAQTFYKQGNHLVQYFKKPGEKHIDSVVYSTLESDLH